MNKTPKPAATCWPRPLLALCLAFVFAWIALAAGEVDDQRELQQLLADAQALPAETKTGRMVADRQVARDLIAYGQRTKTPEAILSGVQLLHKIPVTLQGGAEADNRDELAKLIRQAINMCPNNELLLAMGERGLAMLEDAPRDLAGGPNRWTVTIDKGKYYELDPRLVYSPQEKAIVAATVKLGDTNEEPTPVLGGLVRRSDQPRPKTRSVGRGKVVMAWNTGIVATGWDVRIYNLSKQDVLEVVIEAN